MTEDQKTIQELREQILVLEQQLEWLKRQLFGRKGEQFHHPDLFGDSELGKPETSSEEEQPEEEDDAKKVRKKSNRKTRSAALPQDLPTRTEIIDPEEVLLNPTEWRLINEDPVSGLKRSPATSISSARSTAPTSRQVI